MRTATDQMVFAIEDIDPQDAARFGGKATGLARMVGAGLTVPGAFVIGTDGYRHWVDSGGGAVLPPALTVQIDRALEALEARCERRLGAADDRPLLVSVRSGAKVSMPGMMDTVLNLGITGAGAHALAVTTGRAAFAIDTMLRFWRMFGEIVLQIDADQLVADAYATRIMAEESPGAASFIAVEAAILDSVHRQGADVDPDSRVQLCQAVRAVFESWNSRRARAYRQHHGIPDDLGTAVVVQAMVFGNLDDESGSGVAFSRNPNTGEAELYGEYLRGRQGEDIVSGSHTPVLLDHPDGLAPALLDELQRAARVLEGIYRDAVDIEFTVESSKLYLLQVRAAKRTATAAVKIALALIDENVVVPPEAVRRVSVEQLARLLRPTFDSAAIARARLLAVGIGSSPGHAAGAAVLDAERAVSAAAESQRVILVRPTTSPQDIRGMLAADGIVTVRGGALSHAAVVSRALDKPCIVGCEAIEVEEATQQFRVSGESFAEASPISIDGTSGAIYDGVLPFESTSHDVAAVNRLLRFADLASGCRYWLNVVSDGTLDDGDLSPMGLGPVSLTDLLIAIDRLDELIDGIDLLSKQPTDTGAQELLTRLASEAARPLIVSAAGLDVDIRLPNLGSPRAQRMIGEWASLAPQLFLPMGARALHRSLLRGIARAAESGTSAVTVILGGVTDRGELDALAEVARAVRPIGVDLGVGVSVQNLCALLHVPRFCGGGYAVWIDIMEITRSFFGFPSALSLADEVFERYVSDGLMHQNPRVNVAPELLQTIRNALAGAGDNARVGAECGEGSAPSLVADLRGVGLSLFSLSPSRSATVRLALGHTTRQEGSA